MKKITTLLYFLTFLLVTMTGTLPGTGLNHPSPDAYENYLTIKYHIHLYEFQKAETLIDHYLEKYPEDPFILTEKAFLAYQVKNNSKKALELLKKSKTIYPGYYYANYLQASILYEQYKKAVGNTAKKKKNKSLPLLDEAAKYLETAIKDNKESYDSHLLLGIILSDKGEYAKSNRSFDQAIRINQTGTTYLYKAFNYKQLKDIDGVIASYEKILTFNPSNFGALNALSEIYRQKKDFKRAAVYMEKLFQRYPKNKNVTLEYLYSLFAAGENDKFIEASNMIDIKESPLLVHAKALILSQEQKFDEAKKLLNTIKTNDFSSHILYAEISLHLQDYYQAYQTLEKIAPGNRNHLYYSMQLHTLSLLGLNQRVIDLFDGIKKNKTLPGKLSVNNYYNILYAYGKLDRLEKVREVTQFAKNQLEKDPQSEKLTELLGALKNFSLEKEIDAIKMKYEANIFLLLTFYKNQQQYDKAISILEKMLENDRRKGSAEKTESLSLELCDIYLDQKQFKKAENLLEKLRKEFPSSVSVKNYYAYFLAQHKKKLPHALELSADTLSGDKENPAYLDTYGYILSRMGRFSEAATFLEKAYKKYPFDPEIIDHLAQYYQLKKQNDKIIKIYQKAIDNGVDFKDKLVKKLGELKHVPETPKNHR